MPGMRSFDGSTRSFTHTKAPTLAGCPRYRWTYRARLACVRRLCRDLDELSILVVRSLIPVALGLGPQAFGYRNTQCHRCLVPRLFSVCINPAWAYFWQLCVPRGAASLIPNKPGIYTSPQRKAHLTIWSTRYSPD